MGEAVFDGSNRKLALHMELRLETAGRREIAVDPPEPESQDADEEARPAVATGHARISFQGPGRRLAADDAHAIRPIDGFGHVSRAVDDLTVVAMAVALGDRLPENFDFDCAAGAGDAHRFGHGVVSIRAFLNRHCEARRAEAIHGLRPSGMIASSLTLHAMTEAARPFGVIASRRRSNPWFAPDGIDCFVATLLAMTEAVRVLPA
jgi:hypothetical protein